ncbi:MAG: Restriction endonuclease (HaeIII) [Candidatus Nomurabacteria bacterium GW2011_GWA2_40_9]|uniref:Restriction endonuclease (HaeIII) n=1 Tax=Candidatus Nomurabacteria bacterium GW2011_GWA2_40_9 TaxID=1618734 RepID=A0A0G0TR64_9BACT|nr:MAG: Restriction endonuclease (HaeIII) [Candidatus Nomurabacteria bacterium GW2011_GWA2_40_9]
MTTLESKQMTTGKSFEYALLVQFEEKLRDKTNIEVIKNSAFEITKGCFENVSATEQSEYLLSASFSVNFLMDIEPRLSNDIGKNDILQFEILSDNYGKSGDVRDVLAIRLLQKWEIGVSAKNNHHAVKHSRLSSNIDFGEKWLGIKTSKEYFNTVTPIFNNLDKIRKESGAKKKWSELGDYHSTIYVPILKAFIKELKNLHKNNPTKIASNLVAYLVGNKDFYKVIKGKNSVEIHAYNLNGTLNLPFKNILPKYKTPKVPLPTEIIDISFKEDSNTTAIVTMDNDWTLSFRIHNASSRVESSLKFDINLLKSPKKLFKNTLNISHD